jgi:magnesium transporter
MADTDQIPPEILAESNPPHSSAIDEEDRLRPAFVDKVLDAVAAGDDETARHLVEPLHPADVADLIELAARDETMSARTCSTSSSRSRLRTLPGSSTPTTRSR